MVYQKIFAIDEIDKLNSLLDRNKKIVFTNGCFDILHKGHLELFKYFLLWLFFETARLICKYTIS